ncbi:MAG TPA: hypothetical protein EYO84_09520, partial [Planctomycetes bacterium]|nr:hypothetical protein [Planctomycetota bacterium]
MGNGPSRILGIVGIQAIVILSLALCIGSTANATMLIPLLPNFPLLDCNSNGVEDSTDIANGTSADCNLNGIPDECDIADGTAKDCDNDGVPDTC